MLLTRHVLLLCSAAYFTSLLLGIYYLLSLFICCVIAEHAVVYSEFHALIVAIPMHVRSIPPQGDVVVKHIESQHGWADSVILSIIDLYQVIIEVQLTLVGQLDLITDLYIISKSR